MAKNFRKFFRRGSNYKHGNCLGNRGDRDGRNKVGRGSDYENMGFERSRRERGCNNCSDKNHF